MGVWDRCHPQTASWVGRMAAGPFFLDTLGYSETWAQQEPSDMLNNSTKDSPLLDSRGASTFRGKQEATGHCQTWGPGHQKKADNLIIPPGSGMPHVADTPLEAG